MKELSGAARPITHPTAQRRQLARESSTFDHRRPRDRFDVVLAGCASGRSELIISATDFQLPSGCFLNTVRYFPLSVLIDLGFLGAELVIV